MSERAISAMLLSLTSLVAGCGDDDSNRKVLCPGDTTSEAELSRDERLACLHDTLLAQITASPCPGTGCEVVTFHPVPAAPSVTSEGARILLIDEAIVTVAATRFQSRTLGYLTRDADGAYQASDPALMIARDALDVLLAADRFGSPLASEEIDVAAPFAQKFSDVIPNWTGHGMDILPFLEDRIPRAQFVVSEVLLDDALRDPQICGIGDADTREASLQTLEAQLDRTAQSLAGVIQQYAINYVHLSWGTTRAQIGQFVQSRCGATPPPEVLDRIHTAYLGLLSGMAGLSTPVAGQPRPVVMFQAGTGADHELHAGDVEFLTDCTQFPERLRVFAGAYTGSDIPAGGSSDRKYVTSFAQRTLACNDLLVNVGYTSLVDFRTAPTFFPVSSLGLGVAPRPGWPAVSSFANPVALAYFAYLVEHHPSETVPQLIDRITNQGSKPTVDPLLYGMFPRPSPQ